ncbi:MAG TPA: hypothetical protein VFV83_04815 [Chthoniobacteraceae bacterium]|nr:hypothetical protein [Chthoniobacteraceae bacterium]
MFGLEKDLGQGAAASAEDAQSVTEIIAVRKAHINQLTASAKFRNQELRPTGARL